MNPSFNHSYIRANFAVILRKYTNHTTLIEISVEIQGREYIPDVCLYTKLKMEFSTDIIRMTEMPLLAIEILSSEQNLQDIVDKIEMYFANGVKSCWFITPAIRTVTVYKSFKEFVTYLPNMDLLDETLNLKIEVNEIFE
jgi:Uma2 family endonuclease